MSLLSPFLVIGLCDAHQPHIRNGSPARASTQYSAPPHAIIIAGGSPFQLGSVLHGAAEGYKKEPQAEPFTGQNIRS